MTKRNGLRWVAGRHTSEKAYITRVFNYGTLEEWARMKKRFSKAQIRAAVKNPLRGQWTHRAKTFAEVVFETRMPESSLISYDA